MNAPVQSIVGFGSVSLPATAGTYVQLPNIVCDHVGFGKTAADIRLAGSATPGNAYLLLNTSATGQGANANIAVPCAGNANNLWLASDTATAQIVGFMWLQSGLVYTCPGV
jgi:hypothetical protein